MTEVFNLATQESRFYCLSPEQAVIAAYEQFTCHNWNTWDYNYINHPEFVHLDDCVACGDWTAIAR